MNETHVEGEARSQRARYHCDEYQHASSSEDSSDYEYEESDDSVEDEDDSEDYSESDDLDDDTEGYVRMKDLFLVDDDEEQESENQCCVCYCNLTPRNPPVDLPCCGTNINSNNCSSTMQFCANCIVRCIHSQDWENREYVYPRFNLDRNTIGECPRCRSLLAFWNMTYGPDVRPPASGRVKGLRRAPFDLAVRHAGRMPPMRPLLQLSSYVYPHFIPVEVLEDDAERAQKLCRWGILEQVSQGRDCSIDPVRQIELRAILEHAIGQGQDEMDTDMMASLNLIGAAFAALTKVRVRTAIRLTNQAVAMLVIWVGAFQREILLVPWKGALMACLSVFLIRMLLQAILVLAAYAYVGFTVAAAIGVLLSTGEGNLSRNYVNEAPFSYSPDMLFCG